MRSAGADRPPPRDERLDPATARWLVGPEGAGAVAAASARLDGDPDPLALAVALRRDGLDAAAAGAATSVAQARRRMDTSLVARGFVATPGMLEQSSHPVVASWRSRRFAGAGLVADLCSGAGVDTLAIAARARAVVAVERDEGRAILGRHNTAGEQVHHVVGDALAAPVVLTGLVHADPSRRGPRGRARRLGEYGPPVGGLVAATRRAEGRGIVVSPAVALDDPDLPEGEVEFVEVGGDLVEAVVWTGTLRRPDALATATLLPAGDTLTRTGEPLRLEVGPPGEWLVVPRPALVRARLHTNLGAEIGAHRIARRRALLTTGSAPRPSPWWSAGAIEVVLPLRARHLQAWLRGADERPLELRSHGDTPDVDRLWMELGRPPRGPGGRIVHLVRLDEGAVAIVTSQMT